MRNSLATATVWAILTTGAALGVAASDEADLLNALKSSDESTRLAAIDTLGQRGGEIEGAIPALIEQLADDSAAVRAHAAQALGQIGPAAKEAAEALAERVFDKDPVVRREAVEAYRDIRPGPEVSIPLFAKLFEEADPEVRIYVMDAMAEAGKVAVPPLMKALENEKATYWACLVLAEIGPDAKEAVPALVKVLQSEKRPEVRREAILALAAIGPDAASAVPALAQTLNENDATINGPIVFALGAIGLEAKPAEAQVQKLADLQDAPPMLQTVSLWALARMNPDDEQLVRNAVPRLVLALKSPEPVLRAAAARALIDLDADPEIVRPELKKLMDEASPEVLNEVLDALASLGEKAVPRLIEALKVEEVRAKAAAIIARIGPAAKATVPALIEALSDEDPETRNEILFALAAIGPEAEAAVPELTKALQDPEMNLRYAACHALGKIGPAAMPAKAALQESLAGNERFLSMASAWALARIHPECPETAPNSVPILCDALSESAPTIRVQAAESLQRLGPLAKDALPALKKTAQQDESEMVRKAATEALEAIDASAAPAGGGDATALGPRDKVVTLEDDVQLRVGAEQAAVLPKGSELEVLEVRGKWVGVRARVDGETKIGWVSRTQVGRP